MEDDNLVCEGALDELVSTLSRLDGHATALAKFSPLSTGMSLPICQNADREPSIVLISHAAVEWPSVAYRGPSEAYRETAEVQFSVGEADSNRLEALPMGGFSSYTTYWYQNSNCNDGVCAGCH